jgi:hypothetical protein
VKGRTLRVRALRLSFIRTYQVSLQTGLSSSSAIHIAKGKGAPPWALSIELPSQGVAWSKSQQKKHTCKKCEHIKVKLDKVTHDGLHIQVCLQMSIFFKFFCFD